jgi:heme oxygenase
MSSRPPPIRSALRNVARDAHLRLHRHPALAALAAGRVTLDAYRELLGRLYGFHCPLEAALMEASSRAPFDLRMGERARVWRLRSDLLDLGATSEAIASLPLAGDLPRLDSPGRCLGCLYVREGSTLGGALLARGLDPLLGPANPRGRRFLAGDEGDAALWRDCCDALEAAGALGLAPDVLAGAEETFLSIESWLS